MSHPRLSTQQVARFHGVSEEFLIECVKLGILQPEQENYLSIPEEEWSFNQANLRSYFNIEAASRILEVSERTVKRYVNDKTLRCYRPKSHYKFRLRWLEEFKRNAEF